MSRGCEMVIEHLRRKPWTGDHYMLVEFLLFALIGYIPFVSLFFAMEIGNGSYKGKFVQFALYFIATSVVKLFAYAIILPELGDHEIQAAIACMFISSLEFIPFRMLLVKLKERTFGKAKVTAYWWALIGTVLTTFTQFISNSRGYEFDIKKVVYALTTLAEILVVFSRTRIALMTNPNDAFYELPMNVQVMVFATSLPAAVSRLGLPEITSNAVKIGIAAAVWVIVRLFGEKGKSHQD